MARANRRTLTLEQRVTRLESQFAVISGVAAKVDALTTHFDALTKSLDRLNTGQSVLDAHVYALLKRLDPNIPLEMGPSLRRNEEIKGERT